MITYRDQVAAAGGSAEKKYVHGAFTYLYSAFWLGTGAWRP
jgi:hypothetical protein